MIDLLHYKYLEMCDDELVSALDIVNLIFDECRVSIKMSEETNELLLLIRNKRYGKAQYEAKSLIEFINKMGYIDNELETLSIDEIKLEYKRLKQCDTK